MTTLRGKEEEESKSPEIELSGTFPRKLSVLLTESEDESELYGEGLVEEEKLEEIMQELYKEITITSSSSYNTSPLFAVSGLNGESCGASMSDSSSTVMAGIEFVAPTGNYLTENELTNTVVGGEDEKEINGCDESDIGYDDDDNQWLARVLGWVPLEPEESLPINEVGRII